MRDEFEPAAEETTDVRLAEAGLRLQRPVAQVEHRAGIGLTGHQPLLRQADAGHVGDGILADAPARAEVGEEAGVLLDGVDGERCAIAGGHGFARAELHALEHRGVEGVEAGFAGGRKLNPDPLRRAVHAGDHAEAQLGFPLAHATLSYDAQ